MFAPFEVNDANFLAATLAHYFGADAGAFDVGLADQSWLVAGFDHQDFVEAELVALKEVELFQLGALADLDFMLLAAGGYYCVIHCVCFVAVREMNGRGLYGVQLLAAINLLTICWALSTSSICSTLLPAWK